MQTIGDQFINHHLNLKPEWKIPEDITLIYPYSNPETLKVFRAFYKEYFDDNNPRVVLFGINPGRFGAGVTGVPFTDPKMLEEKCGIENQFHKRFELSSDYIYRLIEHMGGPKEFYKSFLISSLCPLGFMINGINANYYDRKDLTKSVAPHIISNIQSHLDMGCSDQVAFSLGKGTNFKYFQSQNKTHNFFSTVKPLPHPRWVMQYKRKRLNEILDEVAHTLLQSKG